MYKVPGLDARGRWRALLAVTVVACAVLGLDAGQASASGAVTGFAVTPASTQAAGDPDVSEDLTFAYGIPPTASRM
jgi:hypothetical protein